MSQDNPHEIYKSTIKSFKHDPDTKSPADDTIDAYYDWVKAIAPYAKSNPYLPRVYVVNDNADETGNIKPQYHMEKLFDFRKAPTSMLYAIIYKESPTPEQAEVAINKIKQKIQHGKITPEEGKFQLWYDICNHIKINSRNDPLIQEVLDIIAQLVRKKGYKKDMHSGNFMIRRTSIGPQIVVTDPVCTLR